MRDENNDLERKVDNLEREIKRIKKLYEKTLFYCTTDPEVALSQARKSAEAICKSIYLKTSVGSKGKPIEKMMLNELIQELNRQKVIPQAISINLNTIQHFGNFGVHDQGIENDIINEDYVKPCLLALGTVFNWYVANFQMDYRDLEKFSQELDKDAILKEKLKERNDHMDKLETYEEIKDIIVVGNHAPPSRIFENEEATGIYFDILRAIAYHENLKLNFQKYSFDKSLKLLKMGKAHVMIGPNKTQERETYLHYSKIQLPKVPKCFYVNIDAEPVLEYEALYKKILITMKNTFYSEKIQNDSKLTKVEITNYDTGILMANKNPKYVLIMPEVQGDYLLEENDVDLIKSPYSIEGEPSYIAFSKRIDPKVIEAIEIGLKRIIDHGIYDDILSMY